MNSGSNLVLVSALGVGLWFGYKRGYLGDVLAKLGIHAAVPGGVQSGGAPGMGPGAGGTGPTPTAGNVVPVNAYEAALYRQAGNLSTWAQQNRKWCAAIIKVESNGNPVAVSSKGAIGIMQVLPGTAQQMFNGGYTHFQPTAAVLATEAGGIYFGTAYLEYLASIHPDREWVAKAYYGGPGWEGMGAAYKASCETYLTQVKAAYVAIYGGLSA